MQMLGGDMVLPGALDACELREGQRPVPAVSPENSLSARAEISKRSLSLVVPVSPENHFGQKGQ